MGRLVTGTILYLCIAFCLVACTRTMYIPVESVRREYLYRYIYRDRFVHDTISVHDTIREPYPVEKALSKWQQTKMDIGGWAIGAISGILLFGIAYGIYKFIRLNISIK